jgi:thiosulfate/3-mercaptopyruvate sulfurtransferase
MMKKNVSVFLFLLALVLIPCTSGCACTERTIDPIVSVEWLDAHLSDPDIVIIDVRTPEEYELGHVPGALNVPIAQWWVIRDDLLLELPETGDLFDLIGNCGITTGSKVVIMSKIDDDFSRADPGRVAYTLAYAGITNTALLNGGINEWISAGKQITDVPAVAYPIPYYGYINERLVISADKVRMKLWTATLLDARIPEDYFGISPLQFSERPGHIKNAVCLSTPWLFTPDGIFRDIEELRGMAYGVLGYNKWKEVIIYCGVGGYASMMWFVLTQVLNYHNVTMYDGSIQEWTRDPDAPMSIYQWR